MFKNTVLYFISDEPIDYIKRFDVNMEKRIIYFVTEINTIYRRPIDLPIENDMREIIVEASGNISGNHRLSGVNRRTLCSNWIILLC